MIRAHAAQEVIIRVNHEIGVLDQMCRMMAEGGVTLLTVSATTYGGDAIFRFITTDNPRFVELLQARHFNPNESHCILIDHAHKPGMLRKITSVLAEEGINVDHLYGTALESQSRFLIALSTSDDERALVALNR